MKIAKLTKKYIFERKLDGKPIIIQVKDAHGRWATKEDIAVLRKYGILVKHHDKDKPLGTIATHEILTYLIPFDLDHGPISQIFKGQILALAHRY